MLMIVMSLAISIFSIPSFYSLTQGKDSNQKSQSYSAQQEKKEPTISSSSKRAFRNSCAAGCASSGRYRMGSPDSLAGRVHRFWKRRYSHLPPTDCSSGTDQTVLAAGGSATTK